MNGLGFLRGGFAFVVGLIGGPSAVYYAAHVQFAIDVDGRKVQ